MTDKTIDSNVTGSPTLELNRDRWQERQLQKKKKNVALKTLIVCSFLKGLLYLFSSFW